MSGRRCKAMIAVIATNSIVNSRTQFPPKHFEISLLASGGKLSQNIFSQLGLTRRTQEDHPILDDWSNAKSFL